MPLPGKNPFLLLVSIALLTSGCGGGSGNSGGGGGSNPPPPPSTANEWTWMSGSNTVNAVGVYGLQGVASTDNVPGARSYSAGWTDSSGNLWLFGGWGFATNGAVGATGSLNDLWEFTPSTKEWTWVGGSNTASIDQGGGNVWGVYGTQGVASPNNIPGPRVSAATWKDSGGNFWLFGGEGFPSSKGYNCCINPPFGPLNDLWEFTPLTKEWTWVSGSDVISNANGVYGTQGVSSPNNFPGARSGAMSWTDTNGNLWFFGGSGYSDFWEFSTSTKEWTWMAGGNTAGATPIYGTQGVAAASNTPGGRSGSVTWTDKNSNLWLYGGYASGINYDLSDLWEFNPSTKEWTWVSGSNAGGVLPIYGTQGTASASNTPGGRDSAVGWTDSSGNLWLFGGFDYDTTTGANGTNDYLNDLWKFDTTTKEWTWMGGSNTGNANGVYGTLGTPAAGNVPGARGSEGVALTWTDNSGNLWLFGGDGYGATGASDSLLNDLWRYQP